MNYCISLFLAVVLMVGFPENAQAQLFGKKKKEEKKESPKKKKGGLKSYSEVITKEAKTDEGLFAVHQVDDKYYYEIPDSLLNREMLMVTRIAKTAEDYGYGGEKVNTMVLRWEKQQKHIYLRVISYNNVASDSLPIYQSVKNSNLEPILAGFKIEAYNKDSTATVIEITDLFAKDVQALTIPDDDRKRFKISRLDSDRSYIESIKSFPTNIEARNVMTYSASNAPSNTNLGSMTVEINNSMVLLPEEPMQPRLFDQRVGWFTLSQVDFGLDEQKADTRTYLRRWRLEPKDMEAFKRGELVEPKKPIVYYIDPSTPKKWVPYLIQGVNDWQVAFEEAGFKNAIMAKEAPTKEEDPDWSPEDARYSVIRYFASDIQNAYGPHVADPRSGEIIESDIGWYHNVMNLLRNWYFIQTAAVNANAQAVKFDDEQMGQLIRFVSSHEVGHTLGLPHNMGSSYAYPVDSLRSPTFTNTHGTAPSIMDYARFNYVAQPGDGVTSFYPAIGTYDKYAVKWGYRPIPEAQSADEEKEVLDDWIMEHAGDPEYFFGRQTFNPIDPRSQTEDLGNDAMLASSYGIENLKRIVPNLIEWTREEGKNYEDLEELYGQVMGQFRRYMGHVRSNVGGIYEDHKTYDQEGLVYTPVSRSTQRDAVQFLQDQLFDTPKWMIEEDIIRRFQDAGIVDDMRSMQVRYLNDLFSFSRLARIIETGTLDEDNYQIDEFYEDMRQGIWSELSSARNIDTYRRNLQRAYVERMQYLMENEQGSFPSRWSSYLGVTDINVSQSDIRAVTRAELKALRRSIQSSLPRFRDNLSRYHLEDMIERIDLILDPRG